MNRREKFSEIVDFKEMNVKEVFSTEDWIFLEAQRELFPRKLMP